MNRVSFIMSHHVMSHVPMKKPCVLVLFLARESHVFYSFLSRVFSQTFRNLVPYFSDRYYRSSIGHFARALQPAVCFGESIAMKVVVKAMTKF